MTEPTGDTPTPEPAAPATGWIRPEPDRPVEPATAGDVVYATVGARIIAIIIDVILLGFVYAIVVAALAAIGGWGALVIGGLVYVGMSLVYFVYFWTRQRATLGQRFLGLETVNAGDRATLTQDQALRRWAFLLGPGAVAQILAYGGGTVVGVIGWIAAVVALVYEIYLLYSVTQSPTQQGYHDVQAGTVVVKRAG
jgi:uncharacterized RDD family membrane protein YckC